MVASGDGRSPGIDALPGLSVPATDLPVRRVLPDRADPERSRPLRSHDVGAGGEQHRADRCPGHLPVDLRDLRWCRAVHSRTGPPSRWRRHIRHRLPDAGDAHLSSPRGVPLQASLRSEGHRAGSHLLVGEVDVGLRPGEPARPGGGDASGHGRHRGRRGRRYRRLQQGLPDLRAPALAGDGLPCNSHAALCIPVGGLR